jgi:3-hydroxyisobutyrate dehydrogenase-like beta-hydroxyacid dehydrogenase
MSTTPTSPPSIGFVGLGTMGRGMARRLVDTGFDVTVFDVNPTAVNELVAAHAKQGASLEALGEDCDVVMIAVVDDQQVIDIIGAPGERGLLGRANTGTILLIHSTIHPDVCRQLADTAAEVGVLILDAPMTGNPDAAAAGRLSIMVGGDADALDVARPALESFATKVTHLGPVGSGQTAKIANNLAIAVTMLAVHEALQLAGAYGIDADAMLPLLASGGADSWVVRNWGTIGETANEYPGGPKGLGSLTYKDASLALALARKRSVSIPTAAVASQLLDDAYRAAHAHATAISGEQTDTSKS